MSGIFRSSDGGRHWTAVPELQGWGVEGIVVAASDPNLVYAASSSGLYKSTDRGTTWGRIHPLMSYAVAVSGTDPNVLYVSSRSGLMRSDDGGVTLELVGNGLEPLGPVAVDPLNHDIVYLAAFSNDVLYRSTDGGAQWTSISAGLATRVFHTIAVHPTIPNRLFLGTSGEMYRSANSGASWARIALLPPAITASGYAFAISPAAPSIIYAGTERGVFKSTNGGASWDVKRRGWSVLALAVDPTNPQNVLAEIDLDLYRSTNGGATFAISNEDLTSFYTETIAVDPRFPSIVYAGGPSGFAKSDDRGRTWTGLSKESVFDAVVDPVDPSILYGVVNSTLRRSTDGGLTWPVFAGGGPVPGGLNLSFRIDPRNAGTIYALLEGSIYRKVGTGPWESNAELPNGQARFLTVDPTTSALYAGGAAGLFRSVNGGVTWTPAGPGITGTVVGAAVDPFDANHLFAWNSGYDVFESHDGGGSWTSRPNVPASLTFDPSARGVIYSNLGYVHRSVDGGATFRILSPDDRFIDTDRFAIAPDGKTLYTGGTASGVWTYDFDFARRRAARH